MGSEPFEIDSSARYWKIQADGQIPFGDIPDLRVSWTPSELLFLARGEGPWTLAIGRPETVEIPDLPLERMGMTQAAEILSGPAAPLAALNPDEQAAEPDSYDKIALWLVLAVAVTGLSLLALWLARSMNRDKK